MKKIIITIVSLMFIFGLNAQTLVKAVRLDNGKTIKIYGDGTWKEEEFKKPTIEWVSIPAGSFTMGSPSSEVDRRSDEGPQHLVSLSAFKMSKYEITFAQYDMFCEATGRSKPNNSGRGKGNRPVVNIGWHDASAFAEWMGGRLPTEAEWEYACRAGTNTPFNTGNNLTTAQANYDGNEPYNDNAKGECCKKLMPVGSFSPNAWGLYDMHGNATEFCSDWYGAYSSSSQTNPKGPLSGDNVVIRGGDSYSSAKRCRSAFRSNFGKNHCSGAVGFRIVMTP